MIAIALLGGCDRKEEKPDGPQEKPAPPKVTQPQPEALTPAEPAPRSIFSPGLDNIPPGEGRPATPLGSARNATPGQIPIHPDRDPPSADSGASVTQQIAQMKKKLAIDTAALNKAQDLCAARLKSFGPYKTALDQKEEAAAAARNGDPDAAHQLLVATQSVTDLRRSALRSDPNVAAAQGNVDADQAELARLAKLAK